MKANQRHHSVHPPSAVKANTAVNAKSGCVATEKPAAPNANFSLPSPVGVDPINARVTAASTEIDLPNDDCNNPDDPECDDRMKGRTFVY